MSNPFCEKAMVLTGQGRKLAEQLGELAPRQAQKLLSGGYFSALRRAAVAGSLPSSDDFDRFLTGSYRLVELYSIWKTITIGNVPRDKFIPTLKERNMNVSDWSAGMIKQDAFTVVDKEEQIYLVNVSVRELGFEEATRYDAICQRAKERGLKLCPPEVGPQLRFQYLDQPLGEWIVVAMEAIRRSDGGLSVFSVEHIDVGLWLSGHYGGPDYCWGPGDRFVFRARKQPLDA